MIDLEADGMEGFHRFVVGDIELGSFEVFVVTEETNKYVKGEKFEPGWYWWQCIEGSPPSHAHNGPFDTSQDAWQDAQKIGYKP